MISYKHSEMLRSACKSQSQAHRNVSRKIQQMRRTSHYSQSYQFHWLCRKGAKATVRINAHVKSQGPNTCKLNMLHWRVPRYPLPGWGWRHAAHRRWFELQLRLMMLILYVRKQAQKVRGGFFIFQYFARTSSLTYSSKKCHTQKCEST